MNGHIIPNSNIAVDFWRVKGRQDNLIHFLTHLHGDHIVGLTSSWTKPIYCSNITAQLLKAKYGISNQLLHEVPLNKSVVIDLSSSASFMVTAFDANHCPGAVMFYFQGIFGNIFYTGDFRASETLTESCINLNGKIDVLYLDNTFCSPKCVFPSQEECFDKMVEIIEQHPNHNVIIGVRNLGKESMLATLGEVLNETIAVSPEMYNICQSLFETNVFTTIQCQEGSRLRTMPLHQITRQCLQECNRLKPCIAIIPTAIYTGLGFEPFANCSDIFVVPYSDHSSYPELLHFISVLQPAKVVPIVTVTKGPFGVDISDRTDMSCFEPYLHTETASLGNSPIKSHLLINDQFESLSEFHATHTQPMKDFKIYCSKTVGLNYDTEISIRKQKRKKPPLRIKKKARGVILEGSASDESRDRTTPSPESGNCISNKNISDPAEFDHEQSSCDATTEPGSCTKYGRLKFKENSLVGSQQGSGMDFTEELVGASFHQHMEEEQRSSSCKDKPHDFTFNNNKRNNNHLGYKTVHNTHLDLNLTNVGEHIESKSFLDVTVSPVSGPQISCDDERIFPLKILALDTKSNTHTENHAISNFESLDIPSVGRIQKDTSENNLTKKLRNQKLLKTAWSVNKAQITPSEKRATKSVLNITLKQNKRRIKGVNSIPLSKNIRKNSDISCNDDKAPNLVDESSLCCRIFERPTTTNSTLNSKSLLVTHVPKPTDLIKPFVQQKVKSYFVPLERKDKVSVGTSKPLIEFDKNQRVTVTSPANARHSSKICATQKLSAWDNMKKGALPECFLLDGSELRERSSPKEMRTKGRDRSFVNAIKELLAKK